MAIGIKQLILIITFFLQQMYIAAQDTATFRQANAMLFGNSYYFIRADKSDKMGTFIHLAGDDTFQSWYGTGVFVEKAGKIILQYDTAMCHDRVVYVNYRDSSDMLYVRWYDWWGIEREWFSIGCAEKEQYPDLFMDFTYGPFISIPKSALKSNELVLYPFPSDQGAFPFTIPDHVDEVRIYYNEPGTQPFEQKKEVLVKKGNSLIGKGMWTEGNRTKFVQIK